MARRQGPEPKFEVEFAPKGIKRRRNGLFFAKGWMALRGRGVLSATSGPVASPRLGPTCLRALASPGAFAAWLLGPPETLPLESRIESGWSCTKLGAIGNGQWQAWWPQLKARRWRPAASAALAAATVAACVGFLADLAVPGISAAAVGVLAYGRSRLTHGAINQHFAMVFDELWEEVAKTVAECRAAALVEVDHRCLLAEVRGTKARLNDSLRH